jgi:hypothetical protein
MASLIRMVIAIIYLFVSEMNLATNIFIRVSQVGYGENDIKHGVILSDGELDGASFEIVESTDKSSMFSSVIGMNFGRYGNFENSYRFDFTPFKESGTYRVKIKGVYSNKFDIGGSLFRPVAENLLEFFRIQRCGFTNPSFHGICHKADATSVVVDGQTIDTQIDLTGGWHDAGDYVKFLNTTAFATYTLLFAYSFNPEKFGFDNNNNSTPDILEEAKIGLDWLIRCNYKKNMLITQVQDLRDHDVGFRLPEEDPLEFDRPAYAGLGKNTIGIYVAALALGSKIWREKFHLDQFADQCLSIARNIYSLRNDVTDLDENGSGQYVDREFNGKLALGAVELFRISGREELLKQAMEYADSAGTSYWWSYGDISDYAHFRLAEYRPGYADLIEASLEYFKQYYETHVFGEGVEFTWGSNNTLLGISLKNILWKKLSGSKKYDPLAISQRDYVLGKNPWGLSFISKAGSKYSRYFHHQVSKIKKIPLPGGFAAGPVTKSILDSYNIPFEKKDRYRKFQSDYAVYRDDVMDYVTNEPTITANSTAIFVFGNY